MSIEQIFGDPRTRPPPIKAGSEWSSDEVDDLRQLAVRRLKAATIAAMMGRTSAAIRSKAASLGIVLLSDRSLEPITLRRLSALNPSSPAECGAEERSNRA
ncbi:hypothetical protein [Brevundimonas sp.]|uniref:hypothetical protein n=1 Tax=Brevundimonas sp. TaxID=1871086 RepID=UPI003BAD5EEB